MIKAVIFDCFGVLTTDWWREFLASIPEGEGKVRAKQLNHQYDAGLISLKQFSQGVFEATGKQPKMVEDIFASPEPTKNTELLDYIRQLKPRYKIGMISNIGTNWVKDHFLTKQEQELFDDFVFSYLAGTTKPDPKIYELALSNLDVGVNETVFIDDVMTYCTAAEELGIKAINYLDFNQCKSELDKILASDSDK